MFGRVVHDYAADFRTGSDAARYLHTQGFPCMWELALHLDRMAVHAAKIQARKMIPEDLALSWSPAFATARRLAEAARQHERKVKQFERLHVIEGTGHDGDET